MTHARTLPRYACLAGLVAGLLAPVHALAQAAPGVGTWVDEAKTTRLNSYVGGHYVQTPTTTHVYVRATGKWTSFQDGVSRYKNLTVPVAKSTLRKGALAVLGRGFMHPGLQLAIAAAGWAWSMSDGIYQTDENVVTLPDVDDPASGSCSFSPNHDAERFSDYRSAIYHKVGDAEILQVNGVNNNLNSDCTGYIAVSLKISAPPTYVNNWYYARQKTDAPVDPSYPDPSIVSVDPENYPELDPHIPPELADQLWNGEPIPEWQDEISILGQPASQVDSGTRNQPPEVASAVGQWAANMSSQYNGDDTLPYPDADTGGQSAADQQYDDNQEPPPPFPEVEPEWQVEEITSLPDYSMGLGSGSCPAPTTVSLPWGGSFTLSWQPACDLAALIRGAVIGICMILSLYIVLGTRATTS